MMPFRWLCCHEMESYRIFKCSMLIRCIHFSSCLLNIEQVNISSISMIPNFMDFFSNFNVWKKLKWRRRQKTCLFVSNVNLHGHQLKLFRNVKIKQILNTLLTLECFRVFREVEKMFRLHVSYWIFKRIKWNRSRNNKRCHFG